MATRTDIHRPSAIVPLDYEFVGFEYLKIYDIGDSLALIEERKRIQAHRERTGGAYSDHQHGGICHVCGSVNAIYTVLFYHANTNTYVRLGQDCAEKLDMGDDAAFKHWKERVTSALELRAGKNKAKAVLTEAGLDRAWAIYEMDTDQLIKIGAVIEHSFELDEPWHETTNDCRTVCDIVSRLVKWGSVTDKQLNFLHVVVKRVDGRKEMLAKRAAEKEAAANCPSGRTVVTGEVLKVECREDQWGVSIKMTVKDDTGFIVWGTAPSAICLVPSEDTNGQRGLHRGDRVEFTGTIVVSDKDEKFGFFKRPSKASVLQAKVQG